MHILLIFMSIFPTQYRRREHVQRLAEYKIALTRILQLINFEKWSIIICENTFNGSESELRKLLDLQVDNVQISNLYENTGSHNKGIGELDMMTKACETFRGLISKATTVSYLTGRHIVTNDLIFKKTEILEDNALISNPDFFYLDGKILISEKNGLFNDMFFSMQNTTFQSYVEEFKKRRMFLIENNIGSEQFLYSFITQNQISYTWMDNLGLIRRDVRKKFIFFNQSKFHLC